MTVITLFSRVAYSVAATDAAIRGTIGAVLANIACAITAPRPDTAHFLNRGTTSRIRPQAALLITLRVIVRIAPIRPGADIGRKSA